MAKLFFYYAAMNAGKSTLMLQSSHNYLERGMQVLRFLPQLIASETQGSVCSRIGLAHDAIAFSPSFCFVTYLGENLRDQNVSCILIDEAQFLTRQQVWQLCHIVDFMDIPVLTYGLRTDFLGNLFEGSQALLALAEELIEIKTICFCGRKATMTVRVDADGRVATEGKQVEFGGNEKYVSLCRRHYQEAIRGDACVLHALKRVSLVKTSVKAS